MSERLASGRHVLHGATAEMELMIFEQLQNSMHQ